MNIEFAYSIRYMYDNKKMFIFGMARSGYEVAKVLAKHHCDIVIVDQNEQEKDHVLELEQLGIHVNIKDNPEELLDDTFDYVVKNPGIKIDHPLCLKAESLQIPIINEVEVAYHYLPRNVKIIGITGSNGKTTTTTLTYEFLKEAKLPVHLGGNIGFPLCSILNKIQENDILVLEISAQQLHDFKDFKTDIGILTNLTPVHLDNFKTFENYENQKIKIFQHHTKEDIAVLNQEDLEVVDKTKDITSKKIYFSSVNKSDIYIQDDAIYYQGEEVVKLKDILLKGNHNYENIMCAIVATYEFGVKKEQIQNVLKHFNGVEHRLEYVDTIQGRTFYNDSKATNVKSTQIALSAFTIPTILLLGGLDRGHSFLELEEYLKNTKSVVCYGETKERIKTFMDSLHIPCYVVDSLKEATLKAYEISKENDVILLSPACASWDQYKCFEDRGNEFKAVVSSLK